MSKELSRREFIEIGVAAGGGIAIACLINPPTLHASSGDDASAVFRPNAWLYIHPDNRVVFMMDRAEMGQGVYTSLATIIAEELDFSPQRLVIENAPPAKEFGNPDMSGIQVTGGSTSVKVGYLPLRRAGATARAMLMAGAAKTWGVPSAECRTDDGVVSHPASGRSMTYGEASLMARRVDDNEVQLKDPSSFKWVGKFNERLDNVPKTTGQAVFGIDVQVPGMLNCAMIRPPDIRGEVLDFDDSAARNVPGFFKAVKTSSGVAVLGEKYWQAKAAAQVISVRWKPGPLAGVDSDQLSQRYRKLLDNDGKSHLSEGDFAKAYAGAAKRVEAIYEVPYAAHATMEPQNCTADVRADRIEVWAPTQGVGMALEMVERVTGYSRDKIKIHSTFLGGGFGRRVAQDYVAEAVTVSQMVQRPVKLIWSREDDMRHSILRPLTVHRLQAGLDGSGKIIAWSHRIVGQCILSQALPDLVPASMPAWMPRWGTNSITSIASFAARSFGAGALAVEGAIDNLYGIANIDVDFVGVELDVPIGFWRSVGSSHNGFVVEGFMDELAHAAGADPVEFRLRHLPADSPYRRVLTLARDKSGSVPKNMSRGVALHKSFGSYVAEICDVEFRDQTIRPRQVVCAVECGRVVNPDTVRAQIAGGVVFGLSQTLGGKITIKNGGIVESNFHDYPVSRINESPAIDVHIVTSDAPPTGVGEPGVPPIAAAVANAYFAATGERLRQLPLRPGASG
jgi:CO/xanthine dehydrogenase Mo-binding subunit